MHSAVYFKLNIIIIIVMHMAFISVLQAKVALIIICIFRWFGYCYGLSPSPCCMYILALCFFYKVHTSIYNIFLPARQVILGHSDEMLLSYR